MAKINMHFFNRISNKTFSNLACVMFICINSFAKIDPTVFFCILFSNFFINIYNQCVSKIINNIIITLININNS